MLKRLLIKLLIKLTFPKLGDRNDGKEAEWVRSLNGSLGFSSYVAVRDLYLLREMGQGVSEKHYWTLCGQRKELMILAAKASEYKRLVNDDEKEIDYKEKVL